MAILTAFVILSKFVGMKMPGFAIHAPSNLSYRRAVPALPCCSLLTAQKHSHRGQDRLGRQAPDLGHGHEGGVRHHPHLLPVL
jgi:hypothetical protein